MKPYRGVIRGNTVILEETLEGAEGAEAVSVWSVDTPVAKGLVERILKLPHMISVNVIEL